MRQAHLYAGRGEDINRLETFRNWSSVLLLNKYTRYDIISSWILLFKIELGLIAIQSGPYAGFFLPGGQTS